MPGCERLRRERRVSGWLDCIERRAIDPQLLGNQSYCASSKGVLSPLNPQIQGFSLLVILLLGKRGSTQAPKIRSKGLKPKDVGAVAQEELGIRLE